MRDPVALIIGSRQISNFISYEADSNILVPADAFTCRIGRIDSEIKTGDRFNLVVNGELEMTGIIDKINATYRRGSQETSIEGRDLMGLLVDSYVEEYKTLNKMRLKDLAARLLKNVPYLDKSRIYYGYEKKDSGLSKPKKVKRASSALFGDTTSNVCQFEPGTSIFEALSDYAQRHGLLMWMEPEGSLVLGELKEPGEPIEFSFYTYKEGTDRAKNNVLEAVLTDDISKRYSKVTVIAQIQGTDTLGAGEQTIIKSAIDKAAPFYKALVLQSQCTGSKAAFLQAQWELKKREAEGWKVELVVAGHSQEEKNYKANRVCFIKDEVLGLEGNYLILGRKFTMNRAEGPRTHLTIGKLMQGYSVQ